MARITVLLYVALATLTSQGVYGTVNQVPLPTINLTEWWGPGNESTDQDTSISNFSIDFNETMINDLIYRLENHGGFHPPLEDVAFNFGVNSTSLEYWIKYLIEKYPFADRVLYLNQYSHYTMYVQGLRIHFIRVTSQNTTLTVVPLLLIHGWPGSVREFYETIPYLISYGEANGIAFDIIVPSIPGFGYSDGAVRTGLGVDKVAVIFRNLMYNLGFSSYCAQGGGVGAMIASAMATLFPDEVMGLHMNFVFLHNPDIIFRLIMGTYHPEEIAADDVVDRIYPLSTTFFDLVTTTAYLHQLATRPDTVGIVVTNSPVGLMSYTFDKIATGLRKKFIDCPDGCLTEILTEEQILDNFMIYWSTNCMPTAGRLYAETFNKRYFGLRFNEIRSPVPTRVLQAPDEMIYLPPWMIKMKYTNFLNETLPAEGGHYFAWEKPDVFADDVVNAVVAFINWHAMNSTMYTSCSSYITN